MNSTTVVNRLDRVVTREIAGETLLVPIRSNVADMHHIFALNSVAAHIWQALDGKTDVGRILASVCAEFEVDEDQAKRDTEIFLEGLRDAELIREA